MEGHQEGRGLLGDADNVPFLLFFVFFFFENFIEVELIDNVVLISSVQQSDSII